MLVASICNAGGMYGSCSIHIVLPGPRAASAELLSIPRKIRLVILFTAQLLRNVEVYLCHY